MTVVCVDTAKHYADEMKKTVASYLPNANICTFTSPEEAYSYIRTKGCDVLLTEIELKNQNCVSQNSFGLVLANEAKKSNPNVNVIFVTVCDEKEFAKDVIDLRLSGYITKPYEAEKLKYELMHLRNPVIA